MCLPYSLAHSIVFSVSNQLSFMPSLLLIRFLQSSADSFLLSIYNGVWVRITFAAVSMLVQFCSLHKVPVHSAICMSTGLTAANQHRPN